MAQLSKEKWLEIEQDYVFGIVNESNQYVFPSYGDLSEKYKVSRQSIFRKAKSKISKDGKVTNWELQREQFKNGLSESDIGKKVTNAVNKINNVLTQSDIKKIANETSSQIVNFRTKVSTLSEQLINLATVNIQRIEDQLKDDPEKKYIDPRIIKESAASLEVAVSAYDKALGKPREVTPLESKVEELIGLYDKD